MKRAHAQFVITKSEDDGKLRRITGIASTPTVDRGDDIVMPKGAVFKLPLPLLWQHDPHSPIGNVVSAVVTDKGIQVVCEIAKNVAAYIEEAWAVIQAGLVRGFSIGFVPLESSDIEGSWGRRFSKWEWLELSTVTIPMNAQADIQTIKSFDQAQQRAASGAEHRVVRLSPSPGVSGNTPPPTGKGINVKKTIAEQIAAFEAKRAANAARMAAIMDAASEEGETLSAEQETEYDNLATENKSVDSHLVRLKAHEGLVVTTAAGRGVDLSANGAAASRTGTADTGVDIRGGVVSVKRNHAPGTSFTRYAMALAHAKGNLMQAELIAKRWTDTPEVEAVLHAAAQLGSTNIKAASVGDSNNATWAAPLVYYENLASEFIELLRPKTILGKMTRLRRVPFNVRIAGTTSGSTAGWVGEGSPKPVGQMQFTAVNLGHSKAAGIIVITQELARFSSPSAEVIVRDDLMKTIIQFLDQQFIDPAVAAVANVSPASITNGATTVTSTGSSLAQITADIQSLTNLFVAAELTTMEDMVWVMRPGTALALSLKRTSQDVFTFPDITMNGGTWFGIPVIVSNAVPASVSGGAIIALVDQSEVFLADDGNIQLDVSQEASVQMSSTPSAGAQSLVSLWQNNLVGVRAEREINWQKRRAAAVAYIDAVNY